MEKLRYLFTFIRIILRVRMQILSRYQEINKLEAIYKSNKPEFIAVYGRRRVGKTYLQES